MSENPQITKAEFQRLLTDGKVPPEILKRANQIAKEHTAKAQKKKRITNLGELIRRFYPKQFDLFYKIFIRKVCENKFPVPQNKITEEKRGRGRPPKIETIYNGPSIRLVCKDEDERKRIHKAAKRRNMSTRQFLRWLALREADCIFFDDGKYR